MIVVDVDIAVLNKLGKFLSTGKVNISGTQEYIKVIEGLEMLLPDLDLKTNRNLSWRIPILRMKNLSWTLIVTNINMT